MTENEIEETVEETEENEDSAGVPGQIMYPEPEVDAERAAAFAGGKVDSLTDEGEDESEEAGSAEDEESS